MNKLYYVSAIAKEHGTSPIVVLKRLRFLAEEKNRNISEYILNFSITDPKTGELSRKQPQIVTELARQDWREYHARGLNVKKARVGRKNFPQHQMIKREEETLVSPLETTEPYRNNTTKKISRRIKKSVDGCPSSGRSVLEKKESNNTIWYDYQSFMEKINYSKENFDFLVKEGIVDKKLIEQPNIRFMGYAVNIKKLDEFRERIREMMVSAGIVV